MDGYVTGNVEPEPGHALEHAEHGSTLVELLIVAAIIAILAAIAIPVFLGHRDGATESSMKADLHTAAQLMESHYADHHHYPADADELEQPLTTSPHTSITIEEVDGDTYCLLAENETVHSPLRYDSDGGGVLERGAPCE